MFGVRNIGFLAQRPGTPTTRETKLELVSLSNEWRAGTQDKFGIKVPSGYACNWSIVNSNTGAVLTTGTGNDVSYTFGSMYINEEYDINVIATKGTKVFSYWGRADITVLPPLFTQAQANATWDLDSGSFVGYFDYGAVDRPGFKIFVKYSKTKNGNLTTSTTSNSIGTGQKTFITDIQLPTEVGQPVVVSSGANSMTGTVVSYNDASGSLVVNIASVVGSGTFTSWNIQFKVDQTAPIEFLKLKSSAKNNPCHILADPAQNVPLIIESRNTSYPFALKVSADCQNVIIDGCGNKNRPYGFKFGLGRNVTSGLQLIYFMANNSSSTVSSAGKNIRICGVHGDCRGGFVSATSSYRVASSFAIQTMLSSNITYASGYKYSGIRVHKIWMHHGADEEFYAGRTGDNDNYAPIADLMVHRCIFEDSGNDAAQFGNIHGGHIFNNIFRRSGLKGQSGQRNGFVINPGCKDLYVYRNLIDGAAELFQTQTGVKGGNVEVFANVMINNNSNPPSNIFSQISANAEGNNNIALKFYYNTIIIPASSTNAPFYVFYNSGIGATRYNPYIAADNVIVQAGTKELDKNSGTIDMTGWTVNNYKVTNIATPKFKDQANKDYSPLDLTSPMFKSTASYTKTSPFAEYDFNGLKRASTIVGAYAGVDLQTQL
jgi:hypothetical protein